MLSQHVSSVEGTTHTVQVDRYPDSCPQCHTSLHPRVLTGILESDETPGWVQIVFQCVRRECQRIFIATYR
jgi:hypothetical protein